MIYIKTPQSEHRRNLSQYNKGHIYEYNPQQAILNNEKVKVFPLRLETRQGYSSQHSY